MQVPHKQRNEHTNFKIPYSFHMYYSIFSPTITGEEGVTLQMRKLSFRQDPSALYRTAAMHVARAGTPHRIPRKSWVTPSAI